MKMLLKDLREAERKLRSAAAGRPAVAEHADTLARLADVVSARARVVLVGEVNSGKTSLVNRLIDQPVLPVGVLANTRRPQIVRYADRTTLTGIMAEGQIDLLGDRQSHLDPSLDRIEIGIPNRRLRGFDLVDTPGVSPWPRFDPATLPTCDLLIWCTLATQAWRESERSYWMQLPARHWRHAILVATHKDCLRNEDEAGQVRARLAAETAMCFRSIVLVGNGAAASSKQPYDDGLAELDQRINESLATMSKRRVAAAYRIAGHIVRGALALTIREPRPADVRAGLVRAGDGAQ